MLFEKHRPDSLDGIVGHDNVVLQLKDLLKKKDGIPHCLFYGPQGTGKTTIARALGREIFHDNYNVMCHEFNASDDRGIDFVRNTIQSIATKAPVYGPYHVIIMDEADHITMDAQACFRAILEKYYTTTRFFFTANYPYKLIGPIQSRFVQFEMPALDVKTLAQTLKKIGVIEGLVKEDSYYIGIARKASGDMRRAINLLEGNFEATGKTEIDILSIKEIAEMVLSSRVKLAFSGEPDIIFGKIWEKIQKESRWDLLTELAECQFRMNNSIHKSLFIANFFKKLSKDDNK